MAAADDEPIIAVASNLSLPLTEIVAQYEETNKQSIRLTLGSSGNLATQIVQGAPYGLFISANRQYIDLLLEHGIHINSITPFGVGDIGMFIPENSQLSEITSIDEVINALIFRNYRKIAIANPELSPHGFAAVEALHNAGMWAIESSRVIQADSVSLVIPFALSGSVDMAIIPYSYMQLDELKQNGKYIPIPATYYTPINQYLIELKSDNPQLSAFKKFLLSDLSKNILSKYGYKAQQIE